MNYLDNQFNFSNKVFTKQKTVFALLNYTNVEYNSECLVGFPENIIVQHLLLYHMKDKSKNAPTPKAVFFHELGHALHARYAGNVDSVPPKILEYLKILCFPTIESCTMQEQCEIFVNVLSIA